MAEDGLKRDGTEKGKMRFTTRITARHPDTQEKIVDTDRVILADSRAEAREKRDKLRDELVARKLGRIGKSERISFDEACQGYLDSIKRFGTRRTYGSYAVRCRERFGKRYLDSMELDEMQRFVSTIQLGHVAKSGHRSLIVNAFEWAADQGRIKRPHAATGIVVRAPQVELDEIPDPPKNQLEADELPRFLPALEALDAQAHKLVITMLALGCRFAEGSALKRSDFDWATGKGIVRRSQVMGRLGPPKGGKARRVALPPSILEVLRGHVAEMDRLKWPGHEEWLFPAPPTPQKRRMPLWPLGLTSRRIKAAYAASGVSADKVTHMCRHTLNGLLQGEVADVVLRKIVGHTSEAMSARYGDAQVISFAAKVDEIAFRRSGGVSAGDRVDAGDESAGKQGPTRG